MSVPNSIKNGRTRRFSSKRRLRPQSTNDKILFLEKDSSLLLAIQLFQGGFAAQADLAGLIDIDHLDRYIIAFLTDVFHFQTR